MKIRLIPELNNKAIGAIHICYTRRTPYQHDGMLYLVNELKAIGKGKDARLEAELKPVLDH
ncbi:hypothetical protein M3894_002891 [Vibrio metschnikovii]|nr:hypothetical protein [Vibrio metschnikovii]